MRMALGNEIAGLKKIYLDSKYWLLLRDAAIGRRRDGEITELLAVLRNGVQEGRIVCPISEDIFSEVLNQSDTETLNETSCQVSRYFTPPGITLIHPLWGVEGDVFGLRIRLYESPSVIKW